MEGGADYPVRASDAERDHALEAIRDEVAQGRMSLDTFERRIDQVLHARNRTELHDVRADLPPRSRLVNRLTCVISSLSEATARLESAWRTPRLPRFMLPPPGQTRLLIGRAPGCQFMLTDLTVSRFHAEMRQTAAGWSIADLGSMNGTWLNGWRLTGPQSVRPGDQIGFGNLRFVVATHYFGA